jgi:hypothetical protein
VVLSGISTPFGELFRTSGQITHVLRTRAPLYSPLRAFSLDLHVLGTPPAFVLSQDQTLQLRVLARHRRPLRGGSASGASCVLRSQGMRVRILSLLAIQFSKTERHPPIRSEAPSRALNAWSESLRTTGLRQGGRRIYLCRPGSSRAHLQHSPLVRPVTTRGRCLDQPPPPVKPAAELNSAAGPARGATSTPLPGIPSSISAIYSPPLLAGGPVAASFGRAVSSLPRDFRQGV